MADNSPPGAANPRAPLFVYTMGNEAWGEVEITIQGHNENDTLLCSIAIGLIGRRVAHHWFRVPCFQVEALAQKALFEIARGRAESPPDGFVHMLARWGRQGDQSLSICGHTGGFNGTRRDFTPDLDKVTCPACREAHDLRLVG